MASTRVVIERGEARAIYNDAFAKYLMVLPGAKMTRASHVEPYCKRFWSVDLRPVGGEFHIVDEAGRPFRERQQALAFEARWLEQNWLKRD